MLLLGVTNFGKAISRQFSIQAIHNKGRIKVNDELKTLPNLFNRLRTYSTEDPSAKFSHLNQKGEASMVNVTEKNITVRTAIARGNVRINHETTDLVKKVLAKKGDLLTVAQMAGIMGAKSTFQLVPLCHNIPLTKVDVEVKLNPEKRQIDIEATVSSAGKTGVEIEALTAVSVAALTVYDMCKGVSREIVLSDISVTTKTK